MAHVTPVGVEALEQPTCPRQWPRVAIALVEELSRPPVDLLRGFLVPGHVGGKSPAVHPDHRLEPRPRDDEMPRSAKAACHASMRAPTVSTSVPSRSNTIASGRFESGIGRTIPSRCPPSSPSTGRSTPR